MKYKFLAEFRYRPNPLIVDIRGELVQTLLSSKTTEWNIGQDRVDVFNEKKNLGLFVSHRNFGFGIENSADLATLTGMLGDAAKKMPELRFERLGLRLTSLIESQREFEDLMKVMRENLMNESMLDGLPLGMVVRDIATVYELKVGSDSVNLHLGPMSKEQASSYFSDEDIPECSVFVDIDYYRVGLPNDDYKAVRKFIHTARERTVVLRDYLGKSIGSTNE